MPVIMEEDETAGGDFVMPQDFCDLLSLPEPAFTTTEDMHIGGATTTSGEPWMPSLVEPAESMYPDFMGSWDLPAPAADSYLGLEEPDYAKFENWIPQFIRPEKPCEYCRIKRLNCYITRGETACTPCSSLFRDCSLTNTHYLEAANQSTGHLLDTLHVVDEDLVIEQGSRTGIKGLRSKAHASGTSTPVHLDDAPGSSKRNGIRFPRHAVKVLRDWLDAHASNPYPTDDEKAELEERTKLKPSQIANWLANARRRRKVTDKARPRLCLSPSIKPSTPAIDIPQPDKPWDELNPFERWQHSPPENEPASMTDIANAVANRELADDQLSTSPSSAGRRKKRSSNGSVWSNVRAPSTGSLDTAQSSSLSATNSAAYSHQSSQSHGSFGSFNSSLAGKRDRRRRRKPAPTPIRKPGDDKKRIFQCTFCTDTFKAKYDWTRHEKSLHLSLEKWICAPLGPVITDPATGNKRCVYCDELDPSPDHLDTHNHRQCEEKGLDARTFYRKDHLRQHVRLMHNCTMTSFMDNWKSIAVNINSRCGFCAQRFTVWQDRVDHLTVHFKAGARMSEWKGCRGLDPAVAAQVTNAMPPYLIGMESVSPNPFSASNRSTWRQNILSEQEFDAAGGNTCAAEGVNNFPSYSFPSEEETSELMGFGSKATCWEILTVRLGKYANEMAKSGTVLTDEMLQSQARIILYDSDDAWNQTSADNPEWLDLFKKAHGLDFIPSQIGGRGPQVPEDLETYGDLGLRIPFAVQLQAYNQKLGEDQEQQQQKEKERQIKTTQLYRILANEGVLHDANGRCKHTECRENFLQIDRGSEQRSNTTTPAKFRWCSYDLSPQKAREVAKLQGTPEPVGSSSSSSYLQRHRYELPSSRAAEFETITGPWTDSGLMPDSVIHPSSSTALDQQGINTTTGAMMEFLGGNMGNDLPFSTDIATSAISLPATTDTNTAITTSAGAANWIPTTTTAAQEAEMMLDIDRLLAENKAKGGAPTTTSAEELQFLTAEDAFLNDQAMMANLDLDLGMMDFNHHDDGVFDMVLEDSFEG